uniref:Zinc finger protein 541 n=1 Tax=Echinococcus granulosus TaxID=6210 RepID=A0A068WR24_ECHGR|nr:zinc finger protein 541 [Echinococcus granulosus]
MTSRADEDAFAASIFSPSNHPAQQIHLSSPPSSSSSLSRQPNIPPNPGEVSLNRRLRNGLKCPTCSKVFSNSSAIAKHKLTHSDERKHVCHVCKKAFKRQDHLNGHKLTHASKKPHGCQFCDKSYSDARSLRRHYENAHPDEYESWCFLSRAAEEGEASIAEAVAKMTQLSAAVATSSASAFVPSTSSNGNSLAQLVGAKVTNGRNSPWLSAVAGSNGGGSDGGGSGASGRVSPAISERLKAVLMALPLEEPRVVACSLCPRRFKNQSALNGHMRLHGGYGLNHAPGVTASAKAQPPQPPQPPSPSSTPLAASATAAKLKKHQQEQQQAQQLPLGVSGRSLNESLMLLRDLPEAKSESSASLFNWPSTPTTTATFGTTVVPCVSATAATSSRSVRPWSQYASTANQQQPTQSLSQPSSGVYNPARTDLPRKHSELHFNESDAVPSTAVHRGSGFRKHPSSTTFSGPSSPHKFRADPAAHEHAWIAHQPTQLPPPPPPPPPQSLRGRKEMDPIFNNLQLLDSAPTVLRDQSRYISRMALQQFQHHSGSNSSGGGDYPDSSLTMLGAEQSVFFPGASSSPYHQRGDSGTSTSGAPQPHYSPITPASGGFGASSSASSAFTFPPTDALLASVSTASPPMQPQPQPQQQQFLCPCPPKSTSFEETNKWISQAPASVELMLSPPSSIAPMGPFSPPPPPPTLSQGVPTYHEALPSGLYISLREENKQEASVSTPVSSLSHGIGSNQFVLQEQQQQHQPSLYGQRSRALCAYPGYDELVMRHPMTPQHNAHDGQPRAYSYSSTSTQAAYSVPLMPSQERVFFPDELDPLLASQEATKDIRRPVTPIPQLLPPPPPSPQSSHQTQKQCFELGCVPMHKSAQMASASEEGNVFRNPQPPPLLPPPLPTLPLPQTPPLSASSSSASVLKKVKRKPAPIVIPSFTHRINPSRLRSPRLWTVNGPSDGLGGGEASTALMGAAGLGTLLEPPPYTPPPMLSPNRRGSGLFSSIARFKRLPRTATSQLRVSTTTGAVGTSSCATTAARVHKTSVFAASVAVHISPPGPPKSAPAFVKNLFDISSRTLSSSVVVDDGAPPTVAMRAMTPELAEEEGCRASKPLFFGDEDDELTSMLSVAEASGGVAGGRKDTPNTEEASTHSPHRTGTATTIAAINANATNNLPHSSSSSSCCCCSEASPVRPRVDEDEEDADESEDDIVEDIGVPSNFEPKINVGTAYQAEVPEFVDVVGAYHDDTRVYDILVWNPKNIDENDLKTRESLANLMNLARSPVVRNCGLNMEYTFHLLCKFQGDFEMTLRALLHESFTIFDRVYSETEYWTTEEIEKFQTSLRRHDKDFQQVSAELRAYGMNKSVKACVEFYYVWKRMNTPHEVNRYRGRVHRKSVPTRSERPVPEEAAHPPINQICDLTDLENPFHRAPFGLEVPPALGVEGGVASSVSYNLRRKHIDLPPPVIREFEEHGAPTAHELETTTAVVTVVEAAREGSVEGFPCRKCGRCFAKVKSRNAHMKSHRRYFISIAPVFLRFILSPPLRSTPIHPTLLCFVRVVCAVSNTKRP